MKQLELALLFYSYLNEKDDEFLQEHNYSREEIELGVRRLALKYGVSGIGVVILLFLVAAGVSLLITNGMKLSSYEYLEKEEITLAYGVEGIVEKCRAEYEDTHRIGVTIGVVLCIMSVVPLMLVVAFTENEMLVISSVNVLLIFIAAAVNIFIRVGMVHEGQAKLLQIEEYTIEKKKMSQHTAAFPGIYWCFVTAIYFGVSFYTGAWERTWIIWIVAGILFAAVMGIINAIAREKG